MATDIIPLITPSTVRLCDIVSEQFRYVTRYEEYCSQFEKCMAKLRAKKEDVDRKLEEARSKLKEPTKGVSEWLTRFETVEEEWRNLRVKRDTSSRCMNGFLPNPLSRRKMSKQIQKMTPYVNELCQDGDFTEVADDPRPLDVVPQVTSGTVNRIESRERIMNDMMDYLKDDSIRSIGVYGMGGIGKTTLVKNVNDKMLVEHHFKKVIMVTVSKDPNMKEIQGIIAERLGLELEENDPATRANKLYERLKLEESVLIILDDMWNPMELGEFGLRPGTQEMNCKFIITTRNVKVCEQMKVQKKVKMGLLSETESWILFEGKAGPTFGLSKFKSIAHEIVSKCKGSPLAIATLGSTLGKEDEEYVWNNALRVLQNPGAVGLKGIMPEVVTSLTWSYDHLFNHPDVQLCFLRCCFFPEDSNISLADLRNYGIAEKFVKETRTLEAASDELLCHVKILKDCGLLLVGDYDETVKMHDVVRDVAIFIADRDQHGLVVNVDGGSGYLPQSEKLQTCERISLIYNGDKVLSHPLECRKLKSLMVAGADNLTVEYDNLFKESTTLSVLDIRARDQYRENPLMHIPESISCLKNVQTLYLHDCDIFQKVAILGGLTKLEVLGMHRCRIGELPEEIGNLTNLRYLNLSFSRISYVAPNVFSKLIRIEELYMRRGFQNWGRKTKDGTKTNARFKEVATLPHLSILEVDTCEAEGAEGNPDWLKNVKQFRICVNPYLWSEADNDSILFADQNMQKHLWVGKLFKNTKRNCSLVLNSCHGFKSVTELGADGGFNGFEILAINCCDLEKVMVANESHGLFWTLRDLTLSDLKNLEKIFDGVTWPVKFLGQLRSIEVDRCPRLSIIFPCNILFPEKRLENLQTVIVRYCETVQHVFSTEGDQTAIVERPEIECTNSTPARTSLLSGITEISLSELPKLKSIWNGIVPSGSLHGLTKLEVSACGSLQYLLSLDLAVSIHTIKEISVKCCLTMEKIIEPIQEARETSFFPRPPTPPTFESLHCLIIYTCPKLKFLFSFGVARHLKHLHKLSVVRCPGLSEIIGNGEEEPEEMEHNSLLPALQNLQLEELWGLTSFFKGDLPITCPWKEITVKCCPNLTRFPLKTVSSQTSFDAEGCWFRRLDEKQTSVFQRFVKQDEPELDTVHLAVAALWSDDSVSRHEGMTQIWNVLSEPELREEFGTVIVWAVLLRSIELLNREDFPQLQSEAAWMFANVAPSDLFFDFEVVETPIIRILLKLRDSPHEDVREKVALALGMVRDQYDGEDEEEEEDGKDDEEEEDGEDNEAEEEGKDTIDDWVVPIIVKLLSSHQQDIRAQAVLALGTIAGVSAECRDLVLGCGAVIEADVCSRLMELLHHPSSSVIRAALEIIRNIFFREDMQIQSIIDHIDYIANQDFIKPLCDLLDSRDSIIVAHCLNILANILRAGETRGIRDQGGVNSYAHLIAESRGLKKIVNLQHHSDTDIQEEAADIVKAYHLEDKSPPSDTPVVGSLKGLAEELEGGVGNKLGHGKDETQVEALFVGSPVASGIATSSSPLHGDTPLIEEFERVRGNKLGHDNTESQEKVMSLVATSRLEVDDASPTDSFGLGKNKFPILPERSDLATSSSFFCKSMQKHDLNSNVGKNDQSKGNASKQESSKAPTITETMKILDAMDIKIGDPTYFRAIELFQEEGWREAFMCMSDTRRKGWLLRIEESKI